MVKLNMYEFMRAKIDDWPISQFRRREKKVAGWFVSLLKKMAYRSGGYRKRFGDAQTLHVCLQLDAGKRVKLARGNVAAGEWATKARWRMNYRRLVE